MTAPEKMSPEEEAHLEELEADEAYWRYLDELEARAGGAREWDSPRSYGGSK